MLGVLLHAPMGPFYSHKAARSRWRSNWKAILTFCRVAHRTWTVPVRCPISFLIRRSRPLDPQTRWCTGHCPVWLVDRCLGHMSPDDHAADRWPWAPLVHRTVHIFSRSTFTFSRERRVRSRASLGTGHSPVHHRLVLFWLNLAKTSLVRF
jgi:hypothetical protein